MLFVVLLNIGLFDPMFRITGISSNIWIIVAGSIVKNGFIVSGADVYLPVVFR